MTHSATPLLSETRDTGADLPSLLTDPNPSSELLGHTLVLCPYKVQSQSTWEYALPPLLNKELPMGRSSCPGHPQS